MRPWVTNSPVAAAALNAADQAYETALEATKHLPLCQKIEVVREARRVRREQYDAVVASVTP